MSEATKESIERALSLLVEIEEMEASGELVEAIESRYARALGRAQGKAAIAGEALRHILKERLPE